MGIKVATIQTAYWGYFPTTDGTQLVNADSTPVGIISRNGADDGAVTVTVSLVNTGFYYYTITVPNTYAVGDRLGVRITWTVNSLFAIYVDAFQVTSGSDLPTVTGGAVPATTASVQSALTAQGLTTARAAALDTTGTNAATAATQATTAATQATTAATQSTTAASTAATIAAKTNNLPASPASTSDVQPTIVVQGD